MSSDVTPNTYANKINAIWHQSTKDILETARLCAEAREKLSDKQLEELKEKLTFSASMFTKLAKIGANKDLREELSEKLPPHFSIIYQIAGMEKAERDRAIEQGIINPGMTRDELREWQASQPGKQGTGQAEKPEVIAALQAPKSFSSEMRNRLMAALRQLKEQFGFLMDGPPSPEEELRQAVEEIDQEIRQDTRRYVTKVKKLRLHVDGNRGSRRKSVMADGLIQRIK